MRDEQFDRIYNKLEKLDGTVAEINITLAEQHLSLKEHMRRTALLEKQMQPVKRHVENMHAIGWFLLKLLGVISVIVGIYKAFAP